MTNDEKIRINKYLSSSGLGSRRKCEGLVVEGRVRVNGKIISDLGFLVSQNDCVTVDGEECKPAAEFSYVMLHKPKGVITSMSDDKGRKTVIDILPNEFKKLKPVGRLDYDSEGLLLFTNDGDLAYNLTHPSREVKDTQGTGAAMAGNGAAGVAFSHLGKIAAVLADGASDGGKVIIADGGVS